MVWKLMSWLDQDGFLNIPCINKVRGAKAVLLPPSATCAGAMAANNIMRTHDSCPGLGELCPFTADPLSVRFVMYTLQLICGQSATGRR